MSHVEESSETRCNKTLEWTLPHAVPTPLPGRGFTQPTLDPGSTCHSAVSSQLFQSPSTRPLPSSQPPRPQPLTRPHPLSMSSPLPPCTSHHHATTTSCTACPPTRPINLPHDLFTVQQHYCCDWLSVARGGAERRRDGG